MRYAVIDVGSNSVRLMISENGKTLSKEIKTTRLASRLNARGELDIAAAENTVQAVRSFVKRAETLAVDKVYAFATAAVRKAKNGDKLVARIRESCGIDTEILSGEEEAEAGYKGALSGKDGGVIDIGGASTEIAVVSGGVKVYGKSVDLGAVSLTALCGENETLADERVREVVKSFGSVPPACGFYAIGGTATSIAAMLIGSEIYDSEKTHGYKIKKSDLFALKKRLYGMPAKMRKTIPGLQAERADIIQSGAAILSGLAEYLNAQEFTVSERDNTEGYLMMKTEKK